MSNPDIEQIKNTVRQYISLKDEIDMLSARQSELKKRLTEVVEQFGEVDGKGHIVFDVNETETGVSRLVKQRKVSNSLDLEIATRILAEKNLTEKCFELIPQLNQDAVMAAHYQGHLTEQDIDAMFPPKISYAFLVNR